MIPSPTLRRSSLKTLALFASLLVASHAMGATILWDSSPSTVNVNDPTQVSNAGTLFTAVTYWSTNTAVVNGVTFGNFSTAPHFTPFTPVSGSGSGGYTPTNEYGKLIAYGAFLTADAPTGGYNHPAVISGLTIGQQYLIQIWVPVWGSSNWPTQFSFFSDGTRNSSIDNSPTLNMATSGSATSYINGTFTADSTTENLYLFPQTAGGFSYGGISALQIRAVPEPTTVALLALGGIALVVRSRIRRGKLNA